MNLHDWIDELCDALDVDLDVDESLVLDVAREAADNVGAAAGPVSAFLLGYAAARAGGDPDEIDGLADSAIDLARKEVILGQLGADPLNPDDDPARAWARISRSHRPIGDLLMDQAVVAGVGNVYRAEILFRHRIHPLRPGRTLRRRQFDTLWADLAALMEYGVATGRIDTLPTIFWSTRTGSCTST